jgi:glycosyltransferase involved in cell wall biosynthesis
MDRKRLRVLLVIDHFGSGGAQRQIVELACGLKQRGHSVEMFAYFPKRNFFRHRVDEQQIVVHEYDKGLGFSFEVVRRLVALIKRRNIDIVVSYLSSPNIYAELAKLVAPSAKLVVSERTSFHDDRSHAGAFARTAMHAAADKVVANSETQSAWLRRRWWLKHKVSCIYNGIDLARFATAGSAPGDGNPLRLVAIGRVSPEKNALNLIRALVPFQRQFGYAPQISWIGERDSSAAGKLYCQQVDELLESLPEVRRNWRWLGEEPDIPRLLQEHHALIHASFFEGLPNVVCEALAAGMPVLLSNVCDHSLLVADGERGFLFDPSEPGSIAAAIGKLAALDVEDWRRISRNARLYAEHKLGVDRMIGAYEDLFERLLGNRVGRRDAS